MVCDIFALYRIGNGKEFYGYFRAICCDGLARLGFPLSENHIFRASPTNLPSSR